MRDLAGLLNSEPFFLRMFLVPYYPVPVNFQGQPLPGPQGP